MDRSRQHLLLCCAVLSCLFAACRPGPEARKPALSLDQGFEEIFPALSASLVRTCGKNLEPESPEAEAASMLVASPYSAMQILGTGARGPGGAGGGTAGAPPSLPRRTIFVVPFAGAALAAFPAVRSLGYDYDEAYARMGAEAAKALLRSGNGRKPACAIVFQPNFMRGASALHAFSASFAAKAGDGRLVVKNLPSDPNAVDPAGTTAAAIREAEAGDVGLVVLAVDELTPAVAAATAAAKGDGSRMYFADMSNWDAAKVKKSLFAYRIEGDEAAMAQATMGLAGTAAAEADETRGGVAAPRVLVKLRTSRSFFKLFQKIF